jgi:hypothetical protein
MGGRRGDEERGGGRPVEPEEARAHGNDPDAVRIRREEEGAEQRSGDSVSATGRPIGRGRWLSGSRRRRLERTARRRRGTPERCGQAATRSTGARPGTGAAGHAAGRARPHQHRGRPPFAR